MTKIGEELREEIKRATKDYINAGKTIYKITTGDMREKFENYQGVFMFNSGIRYEERLKVATERPLNQILKENGTIEL